MQRDVCCDRPGWRAPIEPAYSGGLCQQRWCRERVRDVRPVLATAPPPTTKTIYNTGGTGNENLGAAAAQGGLHVPGRQQGKAGQEISSMAGGLHCHHELALPRLSDLHHFLSSLSIDFLHPLVHSLHPSLHHGERCFHLLSFIWLIN